MIFTNLAACALEIITAPLVEGRTADRSEGSITSNWSNTDWSKLERLGVAPVFCFAFGGDDTPITDRFGDAGSLLPSSPCEYESRTGMAVIA